MGNSGAARTPACVVRTARTLRAFTYYISSPPLKNRSTWTLTLIACRGPAGPDSIHIMELPLPGCHRHVAGPAIPGIRLGPAASTLDGLQRNGTH